MLINSDVERFDSIMDRILRQREERGNIPDRDEDRISEILLRGERSAVDEHERWVESSQQFASIVKFQPAANDSDKGKEFPNLNRYRNFDFEE